MGECSTTCTQVIKVKSNNNRTCESSLYYENDTNKKTNRKEEHDHRNDNDAISTATINAADANDDDQVPVLPLNKTFM